MSDEVEAPIPIKLVIWDLDDTFWAGTLSEGGATFSEGNAEIVRRLSARGIINSICSKNDYAAAKAELEAHGIWEYFVFPNIAWVPKGPAIKGMIERMQLRPENVLFIDDGSGNREEARHYLPSLEVASPEIVDRLLDLPQLVGKADPELSRLSQYRQLEERADARDVSQLSNDAFLRQSQIHVELSLACNDERARILELINRTNQLNFTKQRLSENQLDELLLDREVESGFVRVSDRYGDYGVCGFYARRDAVLEHFLFSCRILHMGVEQWLYQCLGRPQLSVEGEVSSTLDDTADVDWIAEGAPTPRRASGVHRIFFKGGCDLEQVLMAIPSDSLVAEVNRPLGNGHIQHAEHSEILRASETTSDAQQRVITRLPFLSEDAFQTRMFDPGYDVLVYSLLMDYTQGVYRHRETGLRIPFGDFTEDLTSDLGAKRASTQRPFPDDFFPWFREAFEFEGCLPEMRLVENLRWLRTKLHPSQRLILINAAEVPFESSPERHEHHAQRNRAVEAVVSELANTEICDVRAIVRSRADCSDGIRHYTRRAYVGIASELRELLPGTLPEPSLFQLYLGWGRRLFRRFIGMR